MSSSHVRGKSITRLPSEGMEFFGVRVRESLDLLKTELLLAEMEHEVKVPEVKVRELEYEGLLAEGPSSITAVVSSMMKYSKFPLDVALVGFFTLFIVTFTS